MSNCTAASDGASAVGASSTASTNADGESTVSGKTWQVNLVSTVGLGVQWVDLTRTALVLPGSCKCERFRSCMTRMMQPRGTSIIFSTGSVVNTGARSVTDSRLGIRRAVNLLRTMGVPVRFEQWAYSTRVLKGELSHPVKIDELRRHLVEDLNATVPNKKFPGLIASDVPVGESISPGGAKFTIFRGGSVIVAGVESKEHGRALWARIFKIVAPYADHKNKARSSALYKAVGRMKKDSFARQKKGAVHVARRAANSSSAAAAAHA